VKRHLWRRALIIAVIVLVVAGLLLYILAGVFGWTALGAGVGMAIMWGVAAFLVLGLLVRAVLSRGFRDRELEGVGEPINDLYLGRVSSPPVAKSTDDYSAFPPPHDTGR